MKHGIYIGVRRRLSCETALIREVPGGYLAQFDKLTFRESRGWHFFPKKDFGVLEF